MYILKSRYMLYFVYTIKEVNNMEMIPIKKWGNSNGLRLPKNLMEFLELKTDDRVSIKSEDVNGKRRLIIEPAISKEEVTIEELFKDYTEGKVNIKIQDLGSPVGRELW